MALCIFRASGNEYDESMIASVDVTPELVAEVRRRLKLVKDLEAASPGFVAAQWDQDVAAFHTEEELDAPFEDQDWCLAPSMDPLPVAEALAGHRMQISGEQFWWSVDAKHSDGHWETELMTLDELEALLAEATATPS